MNRRVAALVATVLIALLGPAEASRLRRMPLSELVEQADYIVVVEAVAREDFPTDGAAVKSWSFRVDAQIKGDTPPPVLVVQSFITGGSADCCVAGERYLVFARDGGPGRFVDDGDMLTLVSTGHGQVVSPVNGRYSVLAIEDGRVAWNLAHSAGENDGPGSLPLADAIVLIREELAAPRLEATLPDALLDRIEAAVRLPSGAGAVNDYWRDYALDRATGDVHAVYRRTPGGSGSRNRLRVGELPQPAAVGCDTVRFIASAETAATRAVECAPPPAPRIPELLTRRPACEPHDVRVDAILGATPGGTAPGPLRFTDSFTGDSGALAFDGTDFVADARMEAKQRRVAERLAEQSWFSDRALRVHGTARLRCVDGMPTGLTLTSVEWVLELDVP